MMKVDYSLYLVSDRSFSESSSKLEQHIKDAIEGGVTVVQLREKNTPTSEFIKIAKKLREITTHHKIPLIINDRVDVALASKADGVHLGEEDMSLEKARELLGKDKIIGITVHSPESAIKAYKGGADYLGTEAIFETPTKKYTQGPLGLNTLTEIVKSVPIPVVAIGGINASNIDEVIKVANPAGIAVVSAIMAAKDATKAARELREQIAIARGTAVPLGESNIIHSDSPHEVSKMKERIIFAYKKIRESRPLIHHITNYVVMNETANATLQIGALPVMAHAHEEVEDMVSIANALVLNIGTLDSQWVDSMLLAGKAANKKGIPIILDPVGAGATKFRSNTAAKLLDTLKITILRGNAGEIGSIAGIDTVVKGVESIKAMTNPDEVVEKLAYHYGNVIAMSGKRDFISDGNHIWGVDNGSPWLQSVTGSGCVSTAIIGAFAAVEKDPLVAAVAGYAFVGVASEVAASTGKVEGPGSFKSVISDVFYNLSPDQFASSMCLVKLK